MRSICGRWRIATHNSILAIAVQKQKSATQKQEKNNKKSVVIIMIVVVVVVIIIVNARRQATQVKKYKISAYSTFNDRLIP